MGFELPDGKTARNIQDQVKFLTEKLKDLYAAFNQSGLKKIEIVEELPEVGNDSTLYLLLKDDPEVGNYYEEYLWLDNQWELIGTTEIDLSNYATLDGDNEFTGTNTFTTGIAFDENNTISTSGYNMVFGTGSAFAFNGVIRPTSNNTRDIGTSSYTWKDLYLGGKLYLRSNQTLESNSAGSVVLTTDSNNAFYFGARIFRPVSNNLYDIGSNTTMWKDLYLSGTAYIGSNGNYISSYGNTNALYLHSTNGEARIDFRIRPLSNGNIDIGDSNYRFRALYLSGNLSDGTNTVSVAEIGKVKTVNGNAPDASGNITVSPTNGLYKHTISFSNSHTIILINNDSTPILNDSALNSAFIESLNCMYLGYKVIGIVQGLDLSNTFYYIIGGGTISSDTEGGNTSSITVDSVVVYS